MPVTSAYKPAPTYIDLAPDTGAPFFDAVDPADFPQAIVRYRNNTAAQSIGLDGLSDAEWIQHFCRFEPLPDNLRAPLAIRYHGHQFRHYNRDIGDGRGFLFAQLRDENARLLDLGTKGSGQTPYSRSGDGRLTLKGGVREILATEMLEALGVYTSKTLSIIETGEQLHRGDEPSPARSCVMVRLSHSHVRFGVFQRLAYEQNVTALEQLVDYCITHFYSGLETKTGPDRILGFYASIIDQTARLAAQWMAAGFVHGVLNTDNMNVTGESFDYGPWRFNPVADPNFTAAYFDQSGLYAYGRQPEAAGWNLAQLGGALSQIADTDQLTQTLQTYPDAFDQHLGHSFARRLGLEKFATDISPGNVAMDLLRWMGENGAGFEQVFFDWFGGTKAQNRAEKSPQAPLYEKDAFSRLRDILLNSTPLSDLNSDHPYFARTAPCTMLIEEVETLWASIAQDDDWGPLNAKIDEIRQMGDALGLRCNHWPVL